MFRFPMHWLYIYITAIAKSVWDLFISPIILNHSSISRIFFTNKLFVKLWRDHLVIIDTQVLYTRDCTEPTMNMTNYIHHIFNKLMQPLWDLVFVWYVDFDRNWLRNFQNWLRRIRGHVAFPCTLSTCSCWICMWSMCLLFLGINNLPERRRSLCQPNEMFIFLLSSFSRNLFWRCTHKGSLRQNKLSKLFFHMHLHVVINDFELCL